MADSKTSVSDLKKTIVFLHNISLFSLLLWKLEHAHTQKPVDFEKVDISPRSSLPGTTRSLEARMVKWPSKLVIGLLLQNYLR